MSEGLICWFSNSDILFTQEVHANMTIRWVSSGLVLETAKNRGLQNRFKEVVEWWPFMVPFRQIVANTTLVYFGTTATYYHLP